MARVLVTGASGFIGRFVPALLAARGHDVHLVCRNPDAVEWPSLPPGSSITHAVDLCADGAARALVRETRPTHLLHLAWYAEPGLFWNSPKNLDWVAASLELFKAFADAGGVRFVGAGTCAEYDWRYHTLSSHTTPLEPGSVYGSAKARLFQFLASAAPSAGVSFAWGRIFFPFGPWEHSKRLLPQVVCGLLRGEPVNLSEGSQVRDFVYVEDAAAIFAGLLDSSLMGAVNVASGRGISVRNFAEIAARQLGQPELLRFGALQAGPDATPYMVADVANLNGLLGRPVEIEDGIARTIAWWRKRLRA